MALSSGIIVWTAAQCPRRTTVVSTDVGVGLEAALGDVNTPTRCLTLVVVVGPGFVAAALAPGLVVVVVVVVGALPPAPVAVPGSVVVGTLGPANTPVAVAAPAGEFDTSSQILIRSTNFVPPSEASLGSLASQSEPFSEANTIRSALGPVTASVTIIDPLGIVS